MSTLYPLKFSPILKDKIWGGHKLSNFYGKKGNGLPNIGESWEISGIEEYESVVTNGFLQGNSLNELVEVYMGDLVGDSVYERFGDIFPLLIKFIDAADDLSIQVHPNNEMALERHNAYGKTEMWYVMQADKGAKLISGFNRPMDKSTYLKHLENNTLEQILGYHEVASGDVFFVPAGRVHAIGAGIVVAEIQQTSDITYRIYDFNRCDDGGNPRELHTELAMDAIDFKVVDEVKTNYELTINKSAALVDCSYFTTNIIALQGKLVKDYYQIDSFVIFICVEGEIAIQYNDEAVSAQCGETILLPAELNEVTLNSAAGAKVLEVYIKQKD